MPFEAAALAAAFFLFSASVVQPIASRTAVLPGVTMALLAEVHGPSVTARVNLAEVHDMVAAFATNTTIGVRSISAIDGHFFADE